MSQAADAHRTTAKSGGHRPAPGRNKRLTKRKRVAEILARVLESSVADETELVWFERRHGEATTAGSSGLESPRVTVLVRVVQGGRLGWHRTDVTDPAMLEGAVRHALAVATAQPRTVTGRLFPEPDAEEGQAAEGDASGRAPGPPIRDRAIETLDAAGAGELLAAWCGDDAEGRLHFSRTHLAVWNSHGLRRHATSTEVTLDVTVGDGVGRGFAAASARTLEALRPEDVVERARGRAAAPGGDSGAADVPGGPVTAVL
ncbi:MAG: hypothetical protein AAFX50_18455, partial [Acidobacteriota bacterium]